MILMKASVKINDSDIYKKPQDRRNTEDTRNTRDEEADHFDVDAHHSNSSHKRTPRQSQSNTNNITKHHPQQTTQTSLPSINHQINFKETEEEEP
eukprot:UN00607